MTTRFYNIDRVRYYFWAHLLVASYLKRKTIRIDKLNKNHIQNYTHWYTFPQLEAIMNGKREKIYGRKGQTDLVKANEVGLHVECFVALRAGHTIEFAIKWLQLHDRQLTLIPRYYERRVRDEDLRSISIPITPAHSHTSHNIPQ